MVPKHKTKTKIRNQEPLTVYNITYSTFENCTSPVSPLGNYTQHVPPPGNNTPPIPPPRPALPTVTGIAAKSNTKSYSQDSIDFNNFPVHLKF